MLRVIILTPALATFHLFHSNVQPAFYLPCLHAMPEEACVKICLADRQTGFLMECGNRGGVELGTVRKEWFEYVLVHIFLFIVRYFLTFEFDLLILAVFVIFSSVIFHSIDDILIFRSILCQISSLFQ